MEILNDIEKQQKQILKTVQELKSEVSKLANKQTIAPVVRTDDLAISNSIKAHLGNPSEVVKEVEKNIRWLIEKIPKNVEIKGSVFGFTSGKAAALFLGVFVTVSLGLVYWAVTERKKAEKAQEEVASWREDYQRVQKKNPKVAQQFYKLAQEN